jgi:glycosyltransferase involved in cell wall biosynthesis
MSVYQNDKLKFLEKSVQSILDQSLKELDLFLAIDGPISFEMEEYMKSLKGERIFIHRLSSNQGLAAALNYLLQVVLQNPEYKFIARMDADDISMPDRIIKQRNFLLENNEISCVGTWYQEIDEEGKIISNRRFPVDHEGIRRLFFRQSPMAHPSVVYRRSLIEIAGAYPTDTLRLEDYVLWGNALKFNLKFANLPEYLLQFRVDRNFYSRRSGLKYGWNLIRHRVRIFFKINAPIHAYIYACLYGFARMMPPILLKAIYKAFIR